MMILKKEREEAVTGKVCVCVCREDKKTVKPHVGRVITITSQRGGKEWRRGEG